MNYEVAYNRMGKDYKTITNISIVTERKLNELMRCSWINIINIAETNDSLGVKYFASNSK